MRRTFVNRILAEGVSEGDFGELESLWRVAKAYNFEYDQSRDVEHADRVVTALNALAVKIRGLFGCPAQLEVACTLLSTCDRMVMEGRADDLPTSVSFDHIQDLLHGIIKSAWKPHYKIQHPATWESVSTDKYVCIINRLLYERMQTPSSDDDVDRSIVKLNE